MGEDRKEAQFRKMTGEKIPDLILSLAVPTIISMIVTAIYNTADTYFVSKLGTSASGAVGIVMSLMGLIQSLGFMIGMGSGSWMSRLLGEKKDETASKVAASGFYFSLVLGLLVAVMGCCFLDPLVFLRLGLSFYMYRRALIISIRFLNADRRIPFDPGIIM